MFLNKRKLQDEILDSLDPKDPAAERSRLDLRRINSFLGNKRWLKKETERVISSAGEAWSLLEIGAGDGQFLTSFLEDERLSLTGIDLTSRPKGIPESIGWLSHDILKISELPHKKDQGIIVVCNLILHHFNHTELLKIGKLCSVADHIIIAEPSRRMMPLMMGYAAFPFLGKVTRHDMVVSICAGFRSGELSEYFTSKKCELDDETLRGTLRCHFS